MYRNGIWIKYRIYTFSVCTDSYARHFFSAHSLVYLYSGQLHLLNQCGEALTVGQGECAFIGRDNYSRLYAEPDREAPCRMAFFSLTRQFLCEFYQTLDPACREAFSESLSALHLLPHRPKIESFFHSLLPYIRSGRELSEEVLRLKMIEITCTLLDTDRRYVPTLFDFSGTCGMNLLDLLRKEEDVEIKWRKMPDELYSKPN